MDKIKGKLPLSIADEFMETTREMTEIFERLRVSEGVKPGADECGLTGTLCPGQKSHAGALLAEL